MALKLRQVAEFQEPFVTTPLPPDRKPPIRKLGRGLEALLAVPVEVTVPRGTVPPEVARQPVDTPPSERSTGNIPSVIGAPPTPSQRGLVDLALDAIRPNPRQPRQDFSDAAIASLADSIRSAGVMQPVVVRPLAGGQFEIVAGERRWRAARLVGLSTIPALVRSLDDQASAEWALIENVQREDLNPMERALGLQRLSAEFGLTHQDLAQRVGLDRSSVTNLLRLTELDPFTADAVRTGRLSQGHAKALLAVARADQRQSLAAAAIAGEWSVRETERRAQRLAAVRERSDSELASGPLGPGSAHVADLERRLGEHLGTRVTISLGRKKGTGRISIDFYSLDQFDGLLGRLGFRNES